MATMGSISASVVGAIACLGIGAAALTAAEDAPYRVRGTLTALADDQLTVTNRHGEVVGFQMTDETGVFVVTPATLDDVKSGRFVGLTSIESGGRRVALEAHLFTEDLRGVGEGHYAWDLIDEPNMMTNATIAEIKDVGADRELTVTYKEGEAEPKAEGTQTIYLPPDVPIVQVSKADSRDLLTAGKDVMLIVRHANGTPTVDAIVVGETIKPPM